MIAPGALAIYAGAALAEIAGCLAVWLDEAGGERALACSRIGQPHHFRMALDPCSVGVRRAGLCGVRRRVHRRFAPLAGGGAEAPRRNLVWADGR